jgi:CRP/FNR family transcriptional regulator
VSTELTLDASPIAELIDTWFPPGDSRLLPVRERLQLVQLPAGYDVFRLGDPCRNYLVVVEGSVRVQALSTGGREVVLYRVTDGQSCVITTACLISGEVYPAEGITETRTTGLLVQQSDFDLAMNASAAFRQFVFANQGRRLSDLIQRIEDVAFGRVDARLARHLFDHSRQRGGTITATHQQLAGELGTAREVISRQLKSFEKQGWIRVLRGSVEVLQPQALARLWKNAD